MPEHEYSAREALDLLVEKVDRVSPELTERIRLAIDEGKDVQEEEYFSAGARRRKRRPRYYRKHTAYSDAEALAVAISVLEAHLVESRLLVNAALREFRVVGLIPFAEPTPADPSVVVFEPSLDIAVESEPEAVQEKQNLPDLMLIPTDADQLNSLREVFSKLRPLTEF